MPHRSRPRHAAPVQGKRYITRIYNTELPWPILGHEVTPDLERATLRATRAKRGLAACAVAFLLSLGGFLVSLLWALWQFRELRGHTPLEEQFAAATPALICTGLSMTFVFSLLFVARALGGRAQIDPALLPGISPTRMARRVRHVEACGGIEFEGAVPQRAKGK